MKLRPVSRRVVRRDPPSRLRLRGHRAWLLAVFVVAAIALHDSLGVLLAIMALLVLVDAALPVPREPWTEADERFRQAVRRRRNACRMRRLRGLGPELLDVLDDRAGWASTAPRRALGVQSIPLDSITGTVEEAKATDFDRRFRPCWSTTRRWQRAWLALAQGVELPPISVYRVDGRHVVCDGHHRVSVARDHGWPAIDADVVELSRPAPSRQRSAAA
jgi:hypothetical protein